MQLLEVSVDDRRQLFQNNYLKLIRQLFFQINIFT